MADALEKEAPPPYQGNAITAAATTTAAPSLEMQMQTLLANASSPAQRQALFAHLQQQQLQQAAPIGMMSPSGTSPLAAMGAFMSQVSNAAGVAATTLAPMIGPDAEPLGTRLPEQRNMRQLLIQPGPVDPKQPFAPLRVASHTDRRRFDVFVANYNWTPPFSIILCCVPPTYKFRRGRLGTACYCCGFDCLGGLLCACLPWGIWSPEFRAVRAEFERTFLPRAAEIVRKQAYYCVCMDRTYGANALWESGLIGEANTFLAPHDLYCKATQGPGALGPTIEVYRIARDV